MIFTTVIGTTRHSFYAILRHICLRAILIAHPLQRPLRQSVRAFHMPFSKLGLSSHLLQAIQGAGDYKKPTPNQHQAIPVILAGKDLVATSQTGTGKTACVCSFLFREII